ncbi:hypothetical protein Bhyg_08005 [Pseudolycoriella hygida]|uniref:Uncharacterized protein n=1 Tax=Pseudolycoriella hygida TaxID=35572 RepID=A0A9Q0S385_9DIPT|nr:hypothetical protein Bhyg_08005 [Pseudolycoriella hygida]
MSASIACQSARVRKTRSQKTIETKVSSGAFSAFRLHKTGQRQRVQQDGASGNNQRERIAFAVHPIILVKFVSPTDKVNFISKYLAHKCLCLKDVGFQSEQRIFIKENLTPHNYKIFRLCATAKRNDQLSKFHTRDGICYVALPSNDKMVAIHSIRQLNEVIGSGEIQQSSQSSNNRIKKRKHDNGNNIQEPADAAVSKKRRQQRNTQGQPPYRRP